MKLLHNVLFSVFVLCFLAVASTERVMVLPFSDRSGFDGPWNIKKGIQKYITDFFYDNNIDAVPSDSVMQFINSRKWLSSDIREENNLLEVSGRFGVRYLITGTINKFYVIKKMVGSGRFGGYKHYNAGLEAKIKIFDAESKKWVAAFPVVSHKRDRGLRINLPGKISKDEETFYEIEKEEFGSELFKKSIAGKALNEVCQEILDKLKTAKGNEEKLESAKKTEPVEKPKTVRKKVFEAKILTLVDSTAYVNLGKEDHIAVGDSFPVYTKGLPIIDPGSGDTLEFTDKLVGHVEISFIKARHVSSAKIFQTNGKIKVGDRVRVEK